jgi:hypothetical protein
LRKATNRGGVLAGLIKVEMNDGTLCRMAPKALNLFLARDEVSRFKRSDGWAVVGVDKLRDPKKIHAFDGADRRLVA